MAGYDGHRGWLYAIAVHPDKRRSGIGTQLVKHTPAHLKSLGCIKVNLQIRSTHREVVSFYASVGFFIEDRLSMGAFIDWLQPARKIAKLRMNPCPHGADVVYRYQAQRFRAIAAGAPLPNNAPAGHCTSRYCRR